MLDISTPSIEPSVLADHIILDMLNTVAKIDGALCEYWRSDDDVVTWLAKVANINLDPEIKYIDGELLGSAIQLREVIRELVEQKKNGKALNLDRLNGFLSDSISWLTLEINNVNQIFSTRVYKKNTPRQLLGPLAEAAVDLLENFDFNLIKVCESEECILWFFDKTKAHKRRWCSMATCGNRHKVAKHRKKIKELGV